MLKKILIAISFLSPLATMSATAYAGSTITDKSYWPSAARTAVRNGAESSPNDPGSAFAYDRSLPGLRPAVAASGVEPSWRYHGGPKSSQ